MAYVGYIIDDFDKAVTVAAGMDKGEVFTRTFARIAPGIEAGYAPRMAVRGKDITPKQAAELEAICVEHFTNVYGKDPAGPQGGEQ